MFTDEQFKEFIKILDTREMLIRIDENTKNNQKMFQEHLIQDAGDFALINSSVGKVHDRLDKHSTFQNQVMGAIAVATFIIPIIISFILRGTNGIR